MDHYISRGRGVGNFQKKSCTAKILQGVHGDKNRASAFYYPGPVFDLKKKILHQLLPAKNFMHNLKGQVIAYCPTQTRKIMVRP